MLEISFGQCIIMVKFVEKVGVFEVVLYCYFFSKVWMFEGLIEFIEEILFLCINKIINEEKDVVVCCQFILYFIFGFVEKNFGIICILNGDVLMGEQECLCLCIVKLFECLEIQLKQVLWECRLCEGKEFVVDEGFIVNMFICFIDGCINQFICSGFQCKFIEYFNEYWVCFKQFFFI